MATATAVSVNVPGNGTFVVEVHDISEEPAGHSRHSADLLDGAQETSATDKVRDIAMAISETIRSASAVVHQAFIKNPPAEWTLEINIGFKGTLQIIPVLLSSSSEGALKVTAKWKSG